MKPYISPGNRKMQIPTWSLPRCLSCPGATPLCRKFCYAKKAEKLYPGVLPCRKRNLEISRQGPFVGPMVEAIHKTGSKYFRIHESGDFYSQEYVDKWKAICSQLPQVNFLAFTKSFHLDFSNRPKNLAIVWSIFPDTKLSSVPPGPRAYAGNCKTRSTRKILECPGYCDNCLACWGLRKIGVDVHFNIH